MLLSPKLRGLRTLEPFNKNLHKPLSIELRGGVLPAGWEVRNQSCGMCHKPQQPNAEKPTGPQTEMLRSSLRGGETSLRLSAHPVTSQRGLRLTSRNY